MCCRRQILIFCTSSLQGKPLWGRWPEFSYQAAFQCIASLICILPRKNSMAPLSRLPLQSNSSLLTLQIDQSQWNRLITVGERLHWWITQSYGGEGSLSGTGAQSTNCCPFVLWVSREFVWEDSVWEDSDDEDDAVVELMDGSGVQISFWVLRTCCQ